jgi:hypothetical protein
MKCIFYNKYFKAVNMIVFTINLVKCKLLLSVVFLLRTEGVEPNCTEVYINRTSVASQNSSTMSVCCDAVHRS